MPMKTEPNLPLPKDEAWLRAVAGFMMNAQLAGRKIPEHIGDVPDRMLVDRLARESAKQLLAGLQEVYGVDWWDKASFERAFVRGALEGWRPGSLIQTSPGQLRVASTTCPIAAEVEKDPRLCQSCQALQKHAAYVALFGQVGDVTFERVMSKGSSACEFTLSYRPVRGQNLETTP